MREKKGRGTYLSEKDIQHWTRSQLLPVYRTPLKKGEKKLLKSFCRSDFFPPQIISTEFANRSSHEMDSSQQLGTGQPGLLVLPLITNAKTKGDFPALVNPRRPSFSLRVGRALLSFSLTKKKKKIFMRGFRRDP